MRSVRLSAEQERRLVEAAKRTGRPASEIIREAVTEKCDRLLGESVASRLADVIGSVSSGGKFSARNASRDFGDLLVARQEARRKRRK